MERSSFRWWKFRYRWAAVVGLAVLAGVVAYASSTAWGARLIVTAAQPRQDVQPLPSGVSRALEVERGGVRVRAWVVDPALEVNGRARGTVFILHGIRDSKLPHLPRARRMAGVGYRVVIVDSRGHGESTGQWLTFGVEEAKDLSAFADVLQAEGALTRPLAAVGTSYGAATAIQWAALDERVDTTVAVSSFSSLTEVVPAYAEWMFGSGAALLSDRWVDDVISHAGELASFDPAAACPRCVARNVRGPLLLIHSRDDERIPFAHAEAIAAAAGSSAELIAIDGLSHNETGGNPEVVDAVDAWLARHLPIAGDGSADSI